MEHILSESVGLLDIIFVAVFIASVFLVAYLYSRKASASAFLISEHNLGSWETMATINASKTGAVLIAYTSMIYVFGIHAVWFMVGIIAGYITFVFFGRYLKLQYPNHYSITDYFGVRYSQITRLIVGVTAAAAMFGFVILNIIAIAFTLQFLFQILFTTAVVIGVGLVALYIVFGGFQTVVKTDVIQYILILAILVLLPTIFLFDGVSLSGSSLTGLVDLPAVTLVGFFVLGTLIPFGSPELWQRVFAARSTGHFTKGFIWAGVIYTLFAILLTLVGLFLKSAFPALTPDTAFVAGLSSVVPTGLLWLIAVLLFAAIMSSLDTYVYTTASSLVHGFVPQASAETQKTYIRYVMSIVCALGAVAAITIGSVVNATFFLAITSILGVVTLLSWMRVAVGSVINTGIVCGVGIFVYEGIQLLSSGSIIGPIFVLQVIGGTVVGCGVGYILLCLWGQVSNSLRS